LSIKRPTPLAAPPATANATARSSTILAMLLFLLNIAF
jgi:hypothetical protein